jgi:hypothetical protein
MENAMKVVFDLLKTKYPIPITLPDKEATYFINGKKVIISYIGHDEDGEYFDLLIINGSKIYSDDFYVQNGEIVKDILKIIDRCTR